MATSVPDRAPRKRTGSNTKANRNKGHEKPTELQIAVTGSTGLVGRVLVDELRDEGHRVLPVVRPSSANTVGETIRWDPAEGHIETGAFDGLDAVVHLAGEGIGSKRWTDAQKRRILDSRVQGTTLLCEALADVAHPPAVLLSGSAVGYYGDTGDRQTDEDGDPGDDFPARVCMAWEASTEVAEEAGIAVAHLRTGIVLSPRGGALARQLTPFRLGLGGRVGGGRQYMSWIHIDDEVRAIKHLLTAGLTGPVNLTSPNPVTNARYTKTLGAVLGRPTSVMPMLGPRALLGRELADSLLLTSQRVVPSALTESGFEFAHPELREALEDLLD